MMNLFKWSFIALIGCAGIGALSGGAVHGADVPAIAVAQTNYNFGELSETAPFSHDFIVKNEGTATLNIKDVQPS